MNNRFLFDLTALQESPEAGFHGGGEYAKFIFHELLKNNIYQFDCIFNPMFTLNEEIINLCNKHKIELFEITSNQDIQNLILTHKYKIFYAALPYQYGDLKLNNLCKVVIVLHGLRDLECTFDSCQKYYMEDISTVLKLTIKKIFFKKYIKSKIKNKLGDLLSINNKQIVTVSNHSKYSLLNFYPNLKESDVKVYNAPIKLLNNNHITDQLTTNYVQKKEYYLLVSANRWIKNNYRAIKAFDELFTEGKLKGKKIVVLGTKGSKKLQTVKNKKRFVFLDYLNEDEFAWYFKNAFCFVYPTLNEGFGYPPLNAMSFKVPVLASAISSVPEVCDNAVLYFNPLSVSEIKNRILQINYNANLYTDLQKKGVLRLEYLMQEQERMLKDMMGHIFKI